jgi:hypothetical protein
VKELDVTRPMKTRADYFADPAGQAKFFDGVDKMVLQKNGFLRWLRILVKPSTKD